MLDIEIYMNTLYINHQTGYLHLDNKNAIFENAELGKKTILLHQIQSIVCLGDIMTSPALMKYCTEQGISIVFLDYLGRFRARVEGAQNGNVLLRLAQFEHYKNTDSTLFIAKAMIAGKLQNSRNLINQYFYNAKNEQDKAILSDAKEQLKQALYQLEQAQNTEEIRGIEGNSAKIYFNALSYAIREDYRKDFNLFDGRSRRPPLDRLNALLSFGYSLLTHECRTALECVGLDSQIGFLHVPRPGRPSLALDLMEEFRSILVDHFVIKLINLRKIKAKDFEIRTGGGVMMYDEPKKLFLREYQTQKKELKLKHSIQKEEISFGLIILLQARLLARYIRGDLAFYLPFIREFKS